MKIFLFYFIIGYLQIVTIYANVLRLADTTTIIIENTTKSYVSIQEEFSPHYTFDEYRKSKSKDTIKIVSSVPFRLVFSEITANKEYVYKSFWLNPNEKIVISKSNLKVCAYSELGQFRINELNFFSQMQDSLGNFEGLATYIPHKRKEPEILLNTVQEIYQNRINFLEKYKKQNKISVEYELAIKDIIFYRQYIEFLGHCNLDGILNKALLNSDKITQFINSFSIKKSSPKNIYYLEAQKWISKMFFLENENYLEQYYSIKKNYTNNSLDYILIDVLDWSIGKSYFSQILDDYLKTAKSEELKKYVLLKYGEYLAPDLKIENPLNKTNQTMLFNLKSQKTISWEDLLKSEGVKYIDFWATWCSGCREAMPKVKNLQDELKSKSFKVIYISVDEKYGVWEKISRKEGLPDENSYLLLNPETSKIKKDYAISILPRYMIVNTTGDIKNLFAPNIYNTNLKIELQKLLK